MISNEIAKHTVAVTEAMFAPRVVKQTPEQQIESIIVLAKSMEKMISSLEKHYLDHRANISESLRMTGDIIDCMEGHKKDIVKGLE